MKASQFQFFNPVLLNISFSVNESFDSETCEIKIRIKKSIQNRTADSATVTLFVEVGEHSPSSPFFLTLQEQAQFRWDNHISAELVDNLLNINAPSLLVGYARPIISNITGNSPFPSYNLPFLDFTDGKIE